MKRTLGYSVGAGAMGDSEAQIVQRNARGAARYRRRFREVENRHRM